MAIHFYCSVIFYICLLHVLGGFVCLFVCFLLLPNSQEQESVTPDQTAASPSPGLCVCRLRFLPSLVLTLPPVKVSKPFKPTSPCLVFTLFSRGGVGGDTRLKIHSCGHWLATAAPGHTANVQKGELCCLSSSHTLVLRIY